MTDDARPELSPDAATVDGRQRLRLPELTPKAMWTTAVAIAILTATAVVGLWWAGTRGLTGAELVTARLDALKIGLSIGVGSGGTVALYLAWRRQRSTEADLDNRERALTHQQQVGADTKAHQELVIEETRIDAVERRITDLYTSAVEQLGSAHAPVRLGGLYALERLGENHENQRETIINVLCAYLRMRYADPLFPGDEATPEQLDRYEQHVQEAQVRVTAQRILHRHRRQAFTQEYWQGVSIDLAGANLTDGNLSRANLTRANLARADLALANLSGANLTGADLTRANLSGADLTGAYVLRNGSRVDLLDPFEIHDGKLAVKPEPGMDAG
jgi:hypothetical protein